ncbi:MAG: AMP-binding protein [Geobacter sp.]|nr:AMP-binding protein [Geobacter sp.]
MTSSIMVNIAAHLPRMAQLQPDTTAIIFPKGNQRLTFQELDRLSDRVCHGLTTHGISTGTRTVLMVTPSPEFFSLTFALFKVGAVPVLVDPGLGIKNLKKCLAEAQPTAFIGIPKAQIARLLFGWAKQSLTTIITVGPRLFWGGNTLDAIIKNTPDQPFSMAETKADDQAAILFTSGSTGPPKGAVYSHGNFSAQVKALKTVYNIQAGEIDLPTFPLFALFAPALGMTAVIPEMDFTRPGSVDPQKIINTIKTHNVTTMFGSPALINRVGRHGTERNVTLPTLKRVISAGAPVPASVLERFSQMLQPGVEIFTPYGATESLPVCSIGSREILGETRAMTDQGAGVCVGRPVAGISAEIIRITDEPIETWDESLKVPDGEIGEIVVQGPQVTRSYFQRPEADRLSKISDPSGGFFHRMGDLGRRDDQGRLWFYGRKSHRVETVDGPLFTIPVEAIFNTHPAVFRSALVGFGAKGNQRPVICIELEKGITTSQDQLCAELMALASGYPHTRGISSILFHPAFPVDIRHNAKIFREKLAIWAEEQIK